MGNRFRRLLSLILLIALGIIIYRFIAQLGGQPGIGGLVLRQGFWLAVLITGGLFVAWYFRARR